MMRGALLLVVMSLVAVPIGTARAKGPAIFKGQGTKVTYEMLPAEIKPAIPVDLSKDKFAARLNNGGTVVLDGVDAVWGTPDFQNNTYTFMALDSLQLKNKARIITGGNTLVIFVNRLVSEDGEILAFSGSDRKAANGSGPGASGKPGDGGGLVSIHVVQKVDGILHVDLTGEEGGDGQPGAGGGQGSKGIQGEDADWDAINCKHGGGNGGKGGVGTKGGRGGDGGSGGQGGSLELINVGKTAIPSAAYTFNAPAPKAGIPAPGAPGGPGGPGGGGGNGGGPCGGGSPGPQGDAGPKGDDGNAGSPGSNGKAVVEHLDIEKFIATADTGKKK